METGVMNDVTNRVPRSGFLAETSIAWEETTQAAADAGIRVTLPRLGIVLSKKRHCDGSLSNWDWAQDWEADLNT